MTEHEHAHAGTLSTPVTRDQDMAPGRASLSAKLDAPANPLVSGLIQRKAERDGNGVADGADHAVASASSSSGMSLPSPIMRKFEASLGTDLSSVRVHTGAESATAASAVGAKAYTMGQDIHFGAGQYDPSSGAGQHLLAHEVAHTVQQRGGSPTRQNKLEVSGPQDAAEHEADHAAEAMVSGAPAQVGGGGGVARMSIQRKRQMTADGKHFAIHADEAYLQPGFNWDAGTPASAAPPAKPAPIHIAMSGAPPVAGLEDLDERNYETSNLLFPDPSIVTKRASAWAAISAAASQLESSFNATAPGVTAFTTAKDQLGPGGDLGPAPTGQNWDPGAGAAGTSLDKIADAQPVGDKTKVKDVFSNNQAQVSDDAVNKGTPAQKQAVSKLFEDSRQGDQHVGTAVTAYKNHLTNDMKIATNGIIGALQDVKIDAAATKVDHGNEEVAHTVEARDKTIAGLKGVVDFFGSVVKAEPAELLKIGSIIGEQIIAGSYDVQIKAGKQKVIDLKMQLQNLKDTRFALAFDSAKASFDSQVAATEGFKQGIRDAILARNRAYEAAAKAAGEKAGGGAEGEKISSAIKAIPKVKTVLAALDQVTSTAATPAYTEAAGVGFNAVRKNWPGSMDLKTFVQALADLKAIKATYGGMKADWQTRLTSLENLVGKFNVPG